MTSAWLDSFFSLISKRYESDQILSPLYVTLIIFSPLALFLLVRLGINPWFLAFPAVFFLLFNLCIVCYYLYNRSSEHLSRDKKWMQTVVDCVRNIGLDTSELEDKRYRITKALPIMGILMIVIVAMYIIILFYYSNATVFQTNPLYMSLGLDHSIYEYLGIGMDEYGRLRIDMTVVNETDPNTLNIIRLMLLFPMILSVLATLLCFDSVFRMPKKHDRMQCSFTEAVSKILLTKGIEVKPMSRSIKNSGLRNAFLLFLFTGVPFIWAFVNFRDVASALLITALFFTVLSIPYMIIVYRSAIKKMSRHIQNQWAYEEYLFSKLNGYESGDSAETATRIEYDRKAVKKKTASPKTLMLAEAFIFVMCVLYLYKIVALGLDATMNQGYDIWSVDYLRFWGLSIMNAFFFLLTFNSLLGIKSRRAKSWKKVTHTCITFAISTVVSAMVLNSDSMTHYFDFNMYITMAVLYVLFLLMIVSKEIRLFYTPYGCKCPKISSWFRFVFFGKLNFEPISENEPKVNECAE